MCYHLCQTIDTNSQIFFQFRKSLMFLIKLETQRFLRKPLKEDHCANSRNLEETFFVRKIIYITIPLPKEIFQKWDLDITNFSEEFVQHLVIYSLYFAFASPIFFILFSSTRLVIIRWLISSEVNSFRWVICKIIFFWFT